MADKFKWLDDFNTTLSGLTTWLDGVFEDMNKYGQEGVDELCRWSGDYVSYYLNYMKANVLNNLHDQYLGQLAIIAALKPIAELDPTDLGSVISAVKTIIQPFIGPYEEAVSFVTELTPRVVTLSNNMMKLALYQPTVEIPDINFDKFQIKFTPFTINDVITGNVPYPDKPDPFQPPTPYKTVRQERAEAEEKAKLEEEKRQAEYRKFLEG